MLLLIYFFAACFHGEVVISSGGSGSFPTFARSSAHYFFLKAVLVAFAGEGERTTDPCEIV